MMGRRGAQTPAQVEHGRPEHGQHTIQAGHAALSLYAAAAAAARYANITSGKRKSTRVEIYRIQPTRLGTKT